MATKSYVWDGRTQRYRDKATGKFIRNETVVNLTQQNITTKTRELDTLLTQVIRGDITLSQYQYQSLEIIKTLHSQQYLVAKGGFRNTTSEDYLSIARDLKTVHYPAFRQLVQDLKDGKLTEAQARARLQGFSLASKSSYYFGQKQSAIQNGYVYGKRFLGLAHQHCGDCPVYAAMGKVPISALILPGQQCACVYRCKCYVEYYKE